MPFVMNDMVGKLRNRLGNPLTFELSDDAIVNAINSALKEYSKFRPRKKEEVLALHKGQSHYPLDSGVIAVVDCILAFREDLKPNLFPLHDVAFYPENLYGDPYVYRLNRTSRSMQFIDELEREETDRFDGHEWNYYPGDNILAIFPAPAHEVQTQVTVAYGHTEATMPAQDEELMLKYAQAEAMETLGLFRSKVRELPTGVGYKMTLDAGETMLKQAAVKRQEFYDEIRHGGSWIVTG